MFPHIHKSNCHQTSHVVPLYYPETRGHPPSYLPRQLDTRHVSKHVSCVIHLWEGDFTPGSHLHKMVEVARLHRSLLGGTCPAKWFATPTLPLRQLFAGCALAASQHVVLVATLVGGGGGGHQSSPGGWACSSVAPRVVEKGMGQLCKPFVASDVPDRVLVRMVGVGLAHAEDSQEHSSRPAAGFHSELEAVGTEAAAVEEVNGVKVAPVLIMHPRKCHVVNRADNGPVDKFTPLSFNLFGGQGGATGPHNKQRLLVHKSPCIERSLPCVKLHVN